MCVNYEALAAAELEHDRYRNRFGTEPPADPGKSDLWPGYLGTFIRRHPHADVGDEAVPDREALNGLFGLVPHWAKDTKFGRNTYNARTETVAEKPSFRDAWRRGQHCIIPAQAFYEPDWRSRKAVPTRIARADGEPMGIAGLWAAWKAPSGETVHSYTMLTINADHHAFMSQFHKEDDEKRSVVILPEASFEGWLNAPPAQSMEFMKLVPEDFLQAVAAPARPKTS